MKKHDEPPILAYAITIFLSAFLLFQVQPMMGKMILPWFGGAASVWTACMLFFQSLLLLGYLYTHWVMRLLSPSRQSFLHIALLLLCLFFLPISPSESLKPQGSEDPTWLILYLLGVTIGLPYMVLSTTGPLVQAWFAKERSDVVPYRLFALSNLGSMLALLAYPLVIESALPTRMQSWMWSAFFCGVCAVLRVFVAAQFGFGRRFDGPEKQLSGQRRVARSSTAPGPATHLGGLGRLSLDADGG